MHFHDLRHTHRTWMDEDHTPEAARAHRLGHAIPSIRGVYAHTTRTMTTQLLDNLQHTDGSPTAATGNPSRQNPKTAPATQQTPDAAGQTAARDSTARSASRPGR
jgi:hypothetical protein